MNKEIKVFKYRPDVEPEVQIGHIVWGPNPEEVAPEGDRARLFELLDWMKEAESSNRSLRDEVRVLRAKIRELEGNLPSGEFEVGMH